MSSMPCTTSRLPFSAGEEQADSRLEAPQEPLLQLRADATGERSAQSPYPKYPIKSIFPQPPLQMMRAKYETAMKEKMLMKLERDRLASRVAALEAQLRQLESNRPPEEVISAKQPSSALTSPHRPLSLLIW